MSVLAPLRITAQQQLELERMVRAATTEQRLARRARMALAAGRGCALTAMARNEGVAPDTVAVDGTASPSAASWARGSGPVGPTGQV
jgi:hypothetical protein